MNDIFRFDDSFCPVPVEVAEADPEALVRELIRRVSGAERTLDEERARALASRRELLLDLVSLADDVGMVVERYGVTSNAREAAIIRSVVTLGKKLFETLRQQGVQPVNAIGEVVDPQTTDVVGAESRDGALAGRVLREVQVGYTWPHGLLRRARVIVGAGTPDVESQAAVQVTPADRLEDVLGAQPTTSPADDERQEIPRQES